MSRPLEKSDVPLRSFGLAMPGEEVHYTLEKRKLFLDCHGCHGCFQTNFLEAKGFITQALRLGTIFQLVSENCHHCAYLKHI